MTWWLWRQVVRMPRWAHRTLLVVGVPTLLLVAAASAAFADQPPLPDIYTNMCDGQAHRCLPAWRWMGGAGSFRFEVDLGPLEALRQAPGAAVTTLLFSLSRLIWAMVLGFARIATSIDWLGLEDSGTRVRVGRTIDEGFVAISELSGGFVTLILLAAVIVTVVSTARRAVGGQGRTSWKDMVRPAVCAGLLVVMFQAADGGKAETWAPSWWLHRGAEITGQVWDVTASPAAQRLAQPPTWDRDGDPNATQNHNSCDHVVLTLHQAGRQIAAGQDGTHFHIAEMMSAMFHHTHLHAWRIAQFDTTQSGARMYCYLLEQSSKTSRWERNMLLTSQSGNSNTGGDNVSLSVLTWATWGEYSARELAALAGCQRDPATGTSGHPDWVQALGGTPAQELINDRCADIFHGTGPYSERLSGGSGGVRDSLGEIVDTAPTIPVVSNLIGDTLARPEDVFRFSSLRNIDARTAPDEAAVEDTIWRHEEVRAFLYGLKGYNTSNSVGVALMSVIIAVVYAGTLGGAVLGATIAQIGAIAFWVLFPLVLMLGMWPTESAKQRFYRALKLGAGMMVARFVMLGILTVLLLLTTLFQELIGALNPFGAFVTPSTSLFAADETMLFAQANRSFRPSSAVESTTRLALEVIPPVAAVMVLKRLFREVGIGNPLGFAGASKMVGSITTNFSDMGTHQPGKLGQFARRHFNPLSTYGALSLARIPARARRMSRRMQSKRGRDRNVPPVGGEGGRQDVGQGLEATQAGRRRPGGSAGPQTGPSEFPHEGVRRRTLPNGGVPTGTAEDVGTHEVRGRVRGLVERTIRTSGSAAELAAQAGGRTGKAGKALGTVTKFMVPAMATAAFGPAGLAVSYAGYKAVQAGGRAARQRMNALEVASQVTSGAGPSDQLPELDGGMPQVAHHDRAQVNASAAARTDLPPPPPSRNAPLPPPPSTGPVLSHAAPAVELRRRFAEDDTVRATQVTMEGYTAHGRFVQADGVWWRDVGQPAADGQVVYEQIPQPDPAMWRPPPQQPQQPVVHEVHHRQEAAPPPQQPQQPVVHEVHHRQEAAPLPQQEQAQSAEAAERERQQRRSRGV